MPNNQPKEQSNQFHTLDFREVFKSPLRLSAMRTRWEQELIQALYRMGFAVAMAVVSSSVSNYQVQVKPNVDS